MVSPEGPKASICFILPYREAIPAAKINKVGFIVYIYFPKDKSIVMAPNKRDIVQKWVDERLKSKIPIQQVPTSFYRRAGISWDVLRTDLIHPICSGNKLFKLKYYLLDAAQKKYTMIQTEGGPWSNHIVATAFAAKEIGIEATATIHGEEPIVKSETLLDAEKYGMELQFKGWDTQLNKIAYKPNAYQIPQGGFGILGAKGAKEMIATEVAHLYTHIVCAVGTGTMLAGLCLAAPNANVLGIVVLKNSNLALSIQPLIGLNTFSLNHDYHFGGYAKKTNELFSFMNDFYRSTNIPLDFVYTGKLMFGVNALIQKNYFPDGSKILTIHSGGLQGNRSLTNGELIF